MTEHQAVAVVSVVKILLTPTITGARNVAIML